MIVQGKKNTVHKQICGIVLGLGGWQNFVYVFFSGHSSKSRDNLLETCFFLSVLFSLPDCGHCLGMGCSLEST